VPRLIAVLTLIAFLLGLSGPQPVWAVEPAKAPFDDPATIRLEDYLPITADGVDESLPRPESILGHEIGARFARHDQVVAWFRALAQASPRVSVVDIGTTYEGRPQITAFITSESNQRSLNRLQEQHMDGDTSAPLFTWHGYSVHGNEASGVQASMVVAWYLAASLDPKVSALLREAVVMIDPALNPDGYGRFSNWGNQTAGRTPVTDPDSRERFEPWPGGRTNHYYFDLNRDWLLLQQPESRNRVAFLREYEPNVMTDHHEMGADGTFFFQPGVPTRWHPLIPQRNRQLTEELGAFHARALDSARRLYYSEESFDDFYPGKGSTWPDLQGIVGVLFEQASSMGLARETAQGTITLPMAVHNHVLASLSSIRGAVEMADELKSYRRAYRDGDLVPKGLPDGWIFDDGGDPARAQALLDVISGQGLDVFGITETVRTGSSSFEPGKAWVVPVLGPRAALVQSMFAPNTSFEDSTFYDVSGWALPAAFGVNAEALRRMPTALELNAVVIRDYVVSGPREAIAWVMPWNDYFAPAALYQLQRAGVRARVAMEPFTAMSDGRSRSFERGSVIVHAADIPAGDERAGDFLARIVAGQAPLVGLDSGLTSRGPQLGSPRVLPLQMPDVALVVGKGVNGYAAGSIWQQLDNRLGMPVALLPGDTLNDTVLSRHTHLLMVDGEYESVSEEIRQALDRWVNNGGVLILTRRAATWAQSLGWLPAADAPPIYKADERIPYGDMAAADGARQIGGAVLKVELDPSHPLSFGVGSSTIGLMRRGRTTLAGVYSNPFTVVGTYARAPLMDGYLPDGYASAIAGKPALLAVPRGSGVVIAFADDPAFRAVWWVGERLVSNAIAFGGVIRASSEID
jgi:hypothetical protein